MGWVRHPFPSTAGRSIVTRSIRRPSPLPERRTLPILSPTSLVSPRISPRDYNTSTANAPPPSTFRPPLLPPSAPPMSSADLIRRLHRHRLWATHRLI